VPRALCCTTDRFCGNTCCASGQRCTAGRCQ
jgi:hypothetical protein